MTRSFTAIFGRRIHVRLTAIRTLLRLTVNFTPPDQRRNYLTYGGTRHIVATEHVRRELDMAGLGTMAD